jgi:hypothetical protein
MVREQRDIYSLVHRVCCVVLEAAVFKILLPNFDGHCGRVAGVFRAWSEVACCLKANETQYIDIVAIRAILVYILRSIF